MFSNLVRFAFVATLAAGVSAAPAAAQDLPAGPEAPLVQKACTACHVAAQFTSQRKTPQQWSETVNTMIGYGAQVSDEEFDRIVNYLAKNFAPPPAAK